MLEDQQQAAPIRKLWEANSMWLRPAFERSWRITLVIIAQDRGLNLPAWNMKASGDVFVLLTMVL